MADEVDPRKRELIAAARLSRYEGTVLRRLSASLAGAAALFGAAACMSFPPAITGLTIFPADASGQPRGASLCRTVAQLPQPAQPKIPLIGVRPGLNPRQGSLWLNDPSSGRVRITLARGTQSFVLYCARLDPSDHFVIAVYLDDDTTPSLTALVDRHPAPSLTPNVAPQVRGFDGTLTANHSAPSVLRGGYRVTLRGGAFPLDDVVVDSLGLWALIPDGVRDLSGTLTLDVEPAATGRHD